MVGNECNEHLALDEKMSRLSVEPLPPSVWMSLDYLVVLSWTVTFASIGGEHKSTKLTGPELY